MHSNLESVTLQSILFFFFFHGREEGWRGSNGQGPLEGEPGVAQALGSSCSFLRDELQHGKKKVCEGLCFLPRPFILILQNLQQTPRLQLGDVLQITFLGEKVLGVFS